LNRIRLCKKSAAAVDEKSLAVAGQWSDKYFLKKGEKMNFKKLMVSCFVLCFLSFVLVSAEIHNAALNGDLTKVKELLAKDPSLLNAANDVGRTPLHVAANSGHTELAVWLIKQGADVNRRESSYQLTPLHLAVWNGHLEVTRLLLTHGADLQAREKDNENALYYAALSNNLELVKYLVGKGLKVKDSGSSAGNTPLSIAVQNGNFAVASYFISRGAEVNARTVDGLFPLFMAAKEGHKDMVLELLAAGAKADATLPDSGLSPLHLASAQGYGTIADALLAKGADANAKDKWNHTPYGLASRYGHHNLVELLLARGAHADETSVKAADASWLKKTLAEGEALVWYTEHSGWAVKTANHLLVFDYYKPDPAPDQPGMANGWVVPAEIKDLPVTVFISHSHADHYSPAVFDWKKEIQNITFVAGFRPEGKDGYSLLPVHEKKVMNGVEIIPIESNDSGQGYFVKVDGVSIFHPGDHANRQRDFSGPFKKEIDYLADQGLKADILFVPVSGCGFGDITAVKKGDYYTMDRLSARYIFPMHAQGNPLQYQQFAKEAKERGYENTFNCAEFPGDCFVVKPSGR
jgi:ankyrin repeat protein/L-ascorbate metabolism protein UlaG (beta-lactamase superfamily)